MPGVPPFAGASSGIGDESGRDPPAVEGDRQAAAEAGAVAVVVLRAP